MSAELRPDLEAARRFLVMLNHTNDEKLTFQTIHDSNKTDNNSAIIRHIAPEKVDALFTYQDKGCGIYVMVNQGDCKGRSKENVIKVRSLFIDLDGAPCEPAEELLKPHIKVESSPGHYHLYWLVADCGLNQFTLLQKAIADKFSGDKTCTDLPRVLRVPGFYHLKTDTPYMTKLHAANDFPVYSTQEVIDGLGLMPDEAHRSNVSPQLNSTKKVYEYTDPKSGEVINLNDWATQNPDFDIVAAVSHIYKRGVLRDGKQHIECPFGETHTDTNPDLSTFIANANPPHYKAFEIHCMHNHCIGRDRLELLTRMMDRGMVSTEMLQATVKANKKRPSYINYPAQDIALALQQRRIEPDEFRIWQNIMYMTLLSQDGTICDDNWQIARNLHIQQADWEKYRDILLRTDWLRVEGNRLYCPLIRQEFLKAQDALNQAIVYGREGGKKLQENRKRVSTSRPP